MSTLLAPTTRDFDVTVTLTGPAIEAIIDELELTLLNAVRSQDVQMDYETADDGRSMIVFQARTRAATLRGATERVLELIDPEYLRLARGVSVDVNPVP